MKKNTPMPGPAPQTMRENRQQERKGHLKIFFGYAHGTGKTYAMLKAAHVAKRRGIDVVVGYVESNSGPQTLALQKGLETIAPLAVQQDGVIRREFDLDGAIMRMPQLLILDELAHTNGTGARHVKRYQDVEELLKAGIDVYTTVNVQHIEGLNDTVASITGVVEPERIPDSVFDNASQVELVDLEPQELIERKNSKKVREDGQLSGTEDGSFTEEKLTALREIALRRCADRMNMQAEDGRIKTRREYHTEEHVLVCLSSAPSNMKTIRTAAKMANAFRSDFTALFVETPETAGMSEEDKKRLRGNMRLAQQLGAKIETIYGDDVPFQIAEFARLSGVSRIVIGRSTAARRHFWEKPGLTERLIASAQNLDIHIIPDNDTNGKYRLRKVRQPGEAATCLMDIGKSVGILVMATLIGFIFEKLDFSEANIIMLYILGVLLTSVVTSHRAYSLVSSVVSVLIFNFLFTVPKYTFRAFDKGYPVTFLVMFLAAFTTGSLAIRLKNHAKQAAQAAYRTKVLFDTNQLVQQARDRNEIATATANQLIKLLGRDIIFYFVEKGELGAARVFYAGEDTQETAAAREEYISENERAVAVWVLKNNKHAGATTDTLSNARCLYLAVRVNDHVYGVVGIASKTDSLDAFENSVLLSILGECALALENEKNAREKEAAAILAKNEQLRANLLRSISHDLRTPLTSISGNASNLLYNGPEFDEKTKKQIYTDIYDDSMWLINLVENLLAVTRIEEGQMNLNRSAELMDEVIAEALHHINRKSVEHKITVRSSEEFILARIDARLIVQVIINIVDNAVKYTPPGSEITIFTRRIQDEVEVAVSDNGPGIADEIKLRIFDMFYSGANKIADSRRSLGLGLSLCKSIVNAHGGRIWVEDNQPVGTIFKFTLPAGEVLLHE